MNLNRIKVVLVEKGISQTQLAEMLGKSFSTINSYCCNRAQPSLDILKQISLLLKVDIRELICSNAESANTGDNSLEK